jgi:hypothetical protein
VKRTTADAEVKISWTLVGVAFENGDGTINVAFDNPMTTLQLRHLD